METIRTDYFSGGGGMLPVWIPPSSLLVSIMRILMDNHLQDAIRAVQEPYLMSSHAYVAPLEGFQGEEVELSVTIGSNTSRVLVPVTNDPTDLYDHPEPFALYDGKLLMVFNLHMGYTVGGTPSEGYPSLVWLERMPGTLIPMNDHLVGGIAYWSTDRGWQLQVTERRGLFVAGRFSSVRCYYEKRAPFPQVTLGDTPLQRRRLWNRCDDVLRLYGMRRNHLSPGTAFSCIKGRLPGFHLFGLGSELGIIQFLTQWPLYRPYIPNRSTSLLYRTSDSRLIRAGYPHSVNTIPAEAEYGETCWIWMEKAWWDRAEIKVEGALTGEVT